MAVIEKGKFAKPRGRLGHTVIRQFNGIEVTPVGAEEYKRNKCPKARIERDKFGSIIKFSKYLITIPIVSSIWRQSSVKGLSPYHKIVKTNLSLTKDQKLGESNIIVPDTISLPVQNINLNPDNLEISINKLSDQISIIDPYRLIFQFVFVFTNMHSKNKSYPKIKSIQRILTDVKINENISISLSFDGELNNMVKKCSNMIVYMTLILKKELDEKLHWYSSFAKLFNLTQ